jgi:hypothetical protein
MSAEDKALEEASSHLVDDILADNTDEVEDEFVKNLLNSQQRKKTPSPPPATKELDEPMGIIDTDPFGDQPLSDPFNESTQVEGQSNE